MDPIIGFCDSDLVAGCRSVSAGAKAFQKDIPNATVKFLSTGHFALETHLQEIATAKREFLMDHSRDA